MSRHLDATHDRAGSRARWAQRRDRGASAVEYSLMLAAVAVVIVAVVFGFGQVVKGTFQDASDCFAAQDQSAEPYPDCEPPVDTP